MMTSPLGVAVIGTGFGRAVHIPGFQHHPLTQVVAVYHPNLDKAQAIAAQYQIPHAANQLDPLLNLSEVNIVSIATPPFLHYATAKQALSAGKHLLLEKPMTLQVAEVRELYHLAQTQQLTAIADFEFRMIPAWQHLKNCLDQDYVGKIRLIKIDWLVPSRANPNRPWNWYAQAEKGGGALGAIGSHAFDYIAWLFGPIKRLCASLNCAITSRPDPLADQQPKPVTADDTALILAELADGTPCHIALSSVTYSGRGHWLEIYGEKGTLVLGSDNLKDYVHGFHLKYAPADKPWVELDIPKSLAFPEVFTDGRLAPFIRIIDQLVTSIHQREMGCPSLKEGVYSQLLMDLAQQSHRLQSWINVPSSFL